MKHLFVLTGVLVLSFSCSQQEDQVYTNRETRQALYSANSAYTYEGQVIFRELLTGEIEVAIEMKGEKGDETYYFPAHLHFGAYDTPDAPMAAMLSPIDIRTLKSTTEVGELSDGTKLRFDDLARFDGHVKVHLAADGPDYNVILSVGNVGTNSNKEVNMGNITLCAPY